MKKILSKQIVAWQDSLVENFFQRVKERAFFDPKDPRTQHRTKGDEYDSKHDYGVEPTKINQVPVTGFGSTREIDLLSENNPGDPPDPTSGYQEDKEIYGDDQVNDETGPGQTRTPPTTTDRETLDVFLGDPVAISGLFQDQTKELDQGTRFLHSVLYNKTPVRFKHNIQPVN